MHLFPISGANLEGFARVKTFNGKRFEFLFDSLVRTDQTLQIRWNSESFSIGVRVAALRASGQW